MQGCFWMQQNKGGFNMYEYKILDTDGTPEDRDNTIKEYCEKGWRLHTIQRITDGDDFFYDMLTFEREVPDKK